MRKLVLLLPAIATACTVPSGPPPSLQPRAAEAIDPRVPIDRPVNDRPVEPALASRLSELVAQARGGRPQRSAVPPIKRSNSPPPPERRRARAGSPAQALSAAIAAREPTGRALGDIDALGAERLQTVGGIAPNDLAAIQDAGAEVVTIDQRQAQTIAAIQRRLGL